MARRKSTIQDKINYILSHLQFYRGNDALDDLTDRPDEDIKALYQRIRMCAWRNGVTDATEFPNTKNMTKTSDINVIKQVWSNHTKCILSSHGGNGSCCIDIYDVTQDWGGDACIYSLYVHPSFRNKGIAKALLEKAEHIALVEGANKIIIQYDAKESEPFVAGFYIKNGYIPQNTTFAKETLNNQ